MTSGVAYTSVWNIGDPRLGPEQFDFGRRDSVEHQVGQDSVGAWPAVHPSPYDAPDLSQVPTYALTFTLEPEPGFYELVIHGLVSSGPIPSLVLSVNGIDGKFFPQVVDDERAESLAGGPLAGHVEVRASLPNAGLVSGKNRIAIETRYGIEPISSSPTHKTGGSWGSFFYCGLELVHHVGDPPDPSADINPTPLYPRGDRDDSFLAEITVSVNHCVKSLRLEVMLTLSQEVIDLVVSGEQCRFGQFRSLVSIESGTESVKIRAFIDNQTTFEQDLRIHTPRRWTLCLLPQIHIDIGYTDFQANVTELHARNIDLIHEEWRNHPETRFSLDGSLALEWFRETRSDEDWEGIVDIIRQGVLSSNALSCIPLFGMTNAEDFYHQIQRSASMAEEYDVDFSWASVADVPDLVGSLPSLLASVGISYFMGAVNHVRAGTPGGRMLHYASPFRWTGPDGQNVLAFFADRYAQLRLLAGGSYSAEVAAQTIPRLLAPYERDDYKVHNFPIVGTQGHNQRFDAGFLEFVQDWNKKFSSPEIVIETVGGYFERVESEALDLPSLSVDWGAFWEDGFGSDAQFGSAYRSSQERLLSAECACALAIILSGRWRQSPHLLREAWDDFELASEHTWTSHHSISHPDTEQSSEQFQWKRQRVASAEQKALDVERRALMFSAETVAPGQPGILIFNCLSWKRAMEIEVEIPTSFDLMTNQDIASQVVWVRRGVKLLRIRANLEPFGWIFAPLRHGESVGTKLPPASRKVGRPVLENATWRVQVDAATGRILQLRHLETGFELVDPNEGYALFDIITVRGGGTTLGRGLGTERSRLTESAWYLPEPVLTVSTVQMEMVAVSDNTEDISWLCRGNSHALGEVLVAVSLKNDGKVRVNVSFDKRPQQAKEAIYIAFPFAIPSASIKYDRSVGWCEVGRDHDQGGCNDWYTLQNCVAIIGQNLSLTWSSDQAPLFTVGDIVRGKWRNGKHPIDGNPSHLFSWVTNNYWHTNYPASQDGRLSFDYSFEVKREWKPIESIKFGREHRSKPSFNHVYPREYDNPSSPIPASDVIVGVALETSTTDNVYCWMVTDPLSSNSIILRAREVEGRNGQLTVDLQNDLVNATVWSPIARSRDALVSHGGVVTLQIPPFGLKSIVLEFDGANRTSR